MSAESKNKSDIGVKTTKTAGKLGFTLVTAFLIFLIFTVIRKASPEALFGRDAPSFTLEDINGKEVSLSEFKGKVVFLDFWGPWCGPCRRAVPHIEALHQKYKDKGLVVIGMNHEKDHDKVKEFAKDRISYIVLLDADKQFQEYNIRGIPTAYYIDREGKIRYQDVGFGPGKEQEMERKIRELLEIEEATVEPVSL